MNETSMNAHVVQRIELNSTLIILRVAPDGWQFSEFIAGQYGVLGLPGRAPRVAHSDKEETPTDPDKLIRRAYSIGSAPSEPGVLEFFISLVAGGALTPRLFALRPGDPVWLATKITGMFTLQDVPDDQNLILISTGTGLTPYMSMLRSASCAGLRRKVLIMNGARHSWDLGYHEELTSVSKHSDRFTYLPIISRPQAEEVPWDGFTGYVQELWGAGQLEEHWKHSRDPKDCHVFLCGNPSMTREATQMLERDGFKLHSRRDPGNLHVEKYW